jgi:hypothetical protein
LGKHNGPQECVSLGPGADSLMANLDVPVFVMPRFAADLEALTKLYGECLH